MKKSLEKLADIVQESTWMRPAYERRQIKENILQINHELIELLCKIILIKDNDNRIIWINSLDKHLSDVYMKWRINAFKHKDRHLSSNKYYKLLFVNVLGSGLLKLNDKIALLKQQEYDIPEMNDNQKLQLYKDIKSIICNISLDISNRIYPEIEKYIK